MLEDMHTLYPDSYREVCVEDEHNWITAVLLENSQLGGMPIQEHHQESLDTRCG